MVSMPAMAFISFEELVAEMMHEDLKSAEKYQLNGC